jgi:hypothetical protein
MGLKNAEEYRKDPPAKIRGKRVFAIFNTVPCFYTFCFANRKAPSPLSPVFAPHAKSVQIACD